MRQCKWTILSIFMGLVFLWGVAPGAWAQSKSSQEEPVLVGRVSHIEGGEVLRFVPDEKDWVATVKDAPFGLDDALYSASEAKAEFIMPNRTVLRIGGGTQVQMIALEEDVTEVDVASGIARFYNNDSRSLMKVTTPFGYVLAKGKACFDLYVGDESMEVIGLDGQVDFVLESDGSRYDVSAGSSSLISDGRQVTSGQGDVDAEWDDWNLDRENFWARRLQTRGESLHYLPDGLHDEAPVLEENGRWERVEYEGEPRYFWRPLHVSPEWAPFTVGRWTMWHEDNCWVPDEPFGYVTHHYGNWVYVESSRRWYWAPPVVRAAAVPLLNVGYGWYPGRVAWIHSGADIGWVPLGPFEPYYSHRWWGPRSVAVANVGLTNLHYDLGRYRYLDHAVVVNQANFWGVRNYTNVRVKDINKTVIINNYRAAPVVNQAVIKNYNNRQRYNFTDVQVVKKPHQSVINRINKNRDMAGQTGRVHPAALEKKTADLKPGKINGDAKIARPKVTDKLVSEHEMNKPKGEVKFKEREIKRTGRAPQGMGEGRARDRADRPRRSEEKPVVDQPEKAREGKDTRSPREPRSPLPEKSRADQDRRRQQEDRPEMQEPRQWEPKPPREDARPRHGEDRVQPPARPRQEPGPSTQEMKQPRRDERQQIQDPRQREPKSPREDVRPQRGEDRVQPPVRPRQEPSPSTQEMKQPRLDERQQPREAIQPGKQGSHRENKAQDKPGEKKQEPKHGQMTP